MTIAEREISLLEASKIGGTLQLEVSLDWLKQYELRSSEDEIVNFIKKHPRVIFILEVIPQLVEDEFPESFLALELHSDPEIDIQYFLVHIITKLEVEEALARLRELEKKWWNILLGFVQDEFLLGVEISDDEEI